MLVVTGSFTATLVLPLLGVHVDTSIAITITITLPLPSPSLPSPLLLPLPSPLYTCRHGCHHHHCHHHLSQPIDCRIFIAFLLSVQCFFSLPSWSLSLLFLSLICCTATAPQLVFFPLKNCCKVTQRIPFALHTHQYDGSMCRTLYPTKVGMISIITFCHTLGTTGYVKMIRHSSNL